MKRFVVFTVILLCVSQAAIAQCPDRGSARAGTPDAEFNEAKNRSVKVPTTNPTRISLREFVYLQPGDDRDAFQDGAYISTVGYITEFKEMGPESCNCKEATSKAKNGDVHIYLGLEPDAEKHDCMIVEITPKFKKAYPEYRTLLAKGQRVRVAGYLFWDKEHTGNAAVTCTTCALVWRWTNWEIHPVVKFDVL